MPDDRRSPLAVLHLDDQRSFRGGERQLLYLARYLRAQGHSNAVACRLGTPLERAARSAGFEVLTLPFRGEWDLATAWELRRAALSRPRSVLHAHTAHTAGLAFWAALGTPILRVAHRRVDFATTSGWSFRLKYGSADAVIAISEAVQAALLDGGARGAPVSLVRSAVDLTEVPARDPAARARVAARYALPPRARWVGCLAALVDHKDHGTLLRAMARVALEVPDAVLILAGEGPLRAELERLRDDLDLGERVRFLGFVTDRYLLLDSLDALVLSSKEEGMGSVLLEAMSMGIPVAATAAGGIPEVVQDGVSGLLSPAGDEQRLAVSIGRLLLDGGLAARLAKGGRARAQGFSIDAMGRGVEDAYFAALARRP